MSSHPITAARRSSFFAGRTSSGRPFIVLDRIADIEPVTWEAVFAPHWKDYRYFQTLEETFSAQFPQRYIVLGSGWDDGAAAILPIFFVDQELTASLHPRLRALLRPLRKRLTVRMLMAGCIVGDAQIGVANPEHLPAVCAAFDDALEQYARHEGVGIILCKDYPSDYRDAMHGSVASGRYTRLPSLPAVRLKLDFASFEQYVQTRLGKATRKNLRRKFKDLERAEPVALEVKTAITAEEAATVHALYERVARRGDIHFEVFTKEYFLRLSERMPEQARYFLWRQSGRVIAFSFCTVYDGVIYDNDLGLDGELASPLHLYHLTFRDIINWALAHGLTHYYSSPFNYDPKWHLRMDLVPLDLYARHTNGFVNFMMRRLAPLVAPTRQEPLLKHFPNARDL